jgi:hypothetical protein
VVWDAELGRVQEYDWNGSLVRELDFSTAACMQHHDIPMLPNGNTIKTCSTGGWAPEKARGFAWR